MPFQPFGCETRGFVGVEIFFVDDKGPVGLLGGISL